MKRITTGADWTLFLDRDGVINRKLEGDYVKNFGEFEFLPGVLESLARLSGLFNRIIIITNQQGIGRGAMNISNLQDIHQRMKAEITSSGGRIDAIYFCPALADSGDPDRKPSNGMGLKAKKDFPEIDFSKTYMVGDSITDMEFGRSLGLINVFISSNSHVDYYNNPYIDHVFKNLKEFTDQLI